MKTARDNPKGHMVIIGFGDVGRMAAKVLHDSGADFVIVDKNRENFKGSEYRYVIGDGVDENTLKRAGADHAHTVIITLNNDVDTIFSTLVLRNLNPHAVILARANHQSSIDKMYKAGADYVASLPITAGQMLVRLLLTDRTSEDTIFMYEGIQVEKHRVTPDSPLKNKTLQELNLPETTGCTVIGILEDGNLLSEFTPEHVIREDSILAIVGTEEQIKRFRERYGG
jgi:Trk K+ transport system NAD-binding subunit